jgi:hypothetical protein
MLGTLRRATRWLFQRVVDGYPYTALGIEMREPTTDAYGRVVSEGGSMTLVKAIVRFTPGMTVDSEDGTQIGVDFVADVLDGIAPDPVTDRVFLNGMTFRMVRIEPGTTSALVRLHCKRIT